MNLVVTYMLRNMLKECFRKYAKPCSFMKPVNESYSGLFKPVCI